MTGPRAIYCAICREERRGLDGWFLVTENRWTDRVKILSWNDALVRQPGVHAACCAAHVQQLVVHWMAVGSLEYPFAQNHPRRGSSLRSRREPPAMPAREPDTQGTRVLGELAVHRESLERILTERPESLAGILKALLGALGDSDYSRDACESDDMQEEDIYALTEV